MTHRVEHLSEDVTLYCADCLDVLPTLGKVDAVVTSPPYAQQRDYGAKITDWDALMCGTFGALPHHEKTQILVNLGPIHRDGECVPYWEPWREWMRAQGWRFLGQYVWDQGDGLPGDWNGRLAPSHEWVFHFNRKPRQANKVLVCKRAGLDCTKGSSGLRTKNGKMSGWTHMGIPVQSHRVGDSVIRINRDMSRIGPEREHPATFPVQFPLYLLDSFTVQDEITCDPFMGSGTTGVACVKLGRKFTGIEIEPKYFDIACRRIQAELNQPRLDLPEPQKPVQEVLV